MPITENHRTSEELMPDVPENWHPTLAQKTSAARRQFRPLDTDDLITYRKWRRTTLLLYGALAVIMAALSLTMSPTGNPTAGNDRGERSTIASAGRASR
jgi:hypothetical protein